MALVHFGDLTKTNGADVYMTGLAYTAIAGSSDPVILSLGQENSQTLQQDPSSQFFFTNQQAVGTLYAIDVLQRPVYIRLAADPSSVRVSTATALVDIQNQAQAIYNVFLSYGMTRLLAGFALDNVSQVYLFNNGTRWNRATLNTLIGSLHTTFSVGVACICEPSLDAINLFTPSAPSIAPLDVSFSITESLLGAAPEYEDWLIHQNPFYLHTAGLETSIVPDLSRLAIILQNMQYFSMPQVVVQQMGFTTPIMPDGGNGIQFYNSQVELMRRLSYFLETCGITNYWFALDASFGKTSNVIVPKNVYNPLAVLSPTSNVLPNPYGIAGIYIETDGLYIYVNTVQDGSVVLIGQFDYALTPVTAIVPATPAVLDNTMFTVGTSSVVLDNAFGGDALGA
jgi:hypothetical protein